MNYFVGDSLYKAEIFEHNDGFTTVTAFASGVSNHDALPVENPARTFGGRNFNFAR